MSWGGSSTRPAALMLAKAATLLTETGAAPGDLGSPAGLGLCAAKPNAANGEAGLPGLPPRAAGLLAASAFQRLAAAASASGLAGGVCHCCW